MKQVPSRIALQLLRAYKIELSPWFGAACRYQPTCSEYAAEAIQLHGAVLGSLMAMRRLLCCHPFGGSGYDPVPSKHSSAKFKSDCAITD